MEEEYYLEKLKSSVLFNTMRRCFEIEGELSDFVVSTAKIMLNNYISRYTIGCCCLGNNKVTKQPLVLEKRYSSPITILGESVVFRVLETPINGSVNMCLNVEINKLIISKIL